MNKKIKERWVKALRSGEFRKATGQLKLVDDYDNDNYSYCCLGVLCELAVKSKVIKDYNWNNGFLPPAVARWAKLDGEVGNLPKSITVSKRIKGKTKKLKKSSLIAFNDSTVLNLTFNEIAKIIEKNL